MPASTAASEPRPIRLPRRWDTVARMAGFHRSIGFTIDPEESGRGICTVRGKVQARHLNINGVVHGGVYATALDTAMGGAVVSDLAEGESTATTSLYVEYLRPARAGQQLVARGEVLRRGRHLAFVEGKLDDGAGRQFAQAHGTWYIWSAEDRPPARSPPR